MILLAIEYNYIDPRRSIELFPSSYSFRSKEKASMLLLDSIGWETVHTPDYAFSGLSRPETSLIFQYTISGEGRIEIDGTVHRIPSGSAFLVEVPGIHNYYYPEDGVEPWEFVWLNLSGPMALLASKQLAQYSGSLLHLPEDAPPIQLLWSIFEDIQKHEERNLQLLTAKTLHWLLSLEGFLKNPNMENINRNKKLLAAIAFMKDHYHLVDLSLDDISAHVGISKHHLCRMFKRNMNITPFEYLRRRRIEAAAAKLKTTELTINEISVETGFDNASYFGKVFNSYFGVSPLAYRKQDMNFYAQHIFFES